MKKFISALIITLAAISTCTMVPSVRAESDYPYLKAGVGYKQAVVVQIEECAKGSTGSVCVVQGLVDGTEELIFLSNHVSLGDNLYKECKEKGDESSCESIWKPWIGEVYVQGGQF